MRRSELDGLSAVLFDRDGTLVDEVRDNSDPELVRPIRTAWLALRTLRRNGIRVGMVTNQSGVARGLLTLDQVTAVNTRVADLLGPFDVWRVCPHDARFDCPCRRPRPGMLLDSLAELGVAPGAAAMIGDTDADVSAGRVAGMRSIMVPNARTRRADIRHAPEVAPDLWAAVLILLGWATRPR